MISIIGKWYDGKTSDAVPAVCQIYENGDIRVERLEDKHRLASLLLNELKFSSRIANTPRYFHFPDGEQFETVDNNAVDLILDKFKRHSWLRIVHLLESRKRFVLIALLLLILFIWGSVKYGVPMMSKGIANLLPPSTFRIASEQTLRGLDRSILRISELDEETRTHLLKHFQPVIDSHADYQLTVLFRKGGAIGPNAFALPDGTIIFTDEMVRIAGHDDELLAILVHEVGHVIHRHAMRTVIQDSLLGFALLSMTGDIAGSSEIFLGLPVLLTELAYSREFEREADRYALDWLRSNAIPTAHFSTLMRRINKKMKSMLDDSGKDWLNYLSTHPLSEERIRLFEDGSEETINDK